MPPEGHRRGVERFPANEEIATTRNEPTVPIMAAKVACQNKNPKAEEEGAVGEG
jgi:hypothetical protein